MDNKTVPGDIYQEFDDRVAAALECSKRFCPECQKAGLKSTVQELHATRTLLHCPVTWDEDGNEHHHDSNITTQHYSCSQGHSWTEKHA